MHTACVWSEKLPFAKYSVVKESAFAALRLRRDRPRRAHRSNMRLGDLSACQDEAPSEVIGAKSGGEYRARNGYLLVLNQALSQLS